MKNCEVDCTCDRTECENYQDCEACVLSHRARGYLPHCLRPLAGQPNPPQQAQKETAET